MKALCTRVLVIVVLAGLCAASARASWKVKGMAGGAAALTNVTDNWSGKEKNSQSWSGKLDITAERDTALTNWTTVYRQEYGRSKTAGADELTASDIVDLSTVLTRKLSMFVNPYVGLTATSQHWKFGDPRTITESAGNGFWLINKPAQNLRVRLGCALRQQFDSAKIPESIAETGGEWVTMYDILLSEAAKLVSEARVFTAFKGGASLRWDTSVYCKLSSVLTLQVNYLAIYNYNDTVKPVWPQDMEKRLMLVLGLSYNLF